MIDLSGIKKVIIVDGYGRKYTTIKAKEIHIMKYLGTLLVQHDGDTQHSLKGDHDD